MRNVEKAANDIYLIKQATRENWFCSVTAILGRREIGLVDTGYENTPEDIVFPFLKEMGRSLDEIALVVNTHRDGDHVLGNRVIKEKTKAQIAVHELEYEAVEHADIKLKDGQVVELGERKFRIIHTPGHRPGSICLYDEDNRTVLTGDAIVGTSEELIRMSKEIYIASLKKLLELEVEILLMSHPFEPAGRAILKGEDAQKMIRESIAIAEALT